MSEELAKAPTGITQIAPSLADITMLGDSLSKAREDPDSRRRLLRASLAVAAFSLPKIVALVNRRQEARAAKNKQSMIVPSGSPVAAALGLWLNLPDNSHVTHNSWELSDRGDFGIRPAESQKGLKFEGHPLSIGAPQEENGSGEGPRRGRYFSLTIHTADSEVMKRFLKVLANIWDSRHAGTQENYVFVQGAWGNWGRMGRISDKTIAILPQGNMEELMSDIYRFMSSREDYERCGIPWRRTYLLHGLPRSGKSSTVRKVAAALKKNVYFLTLSGQEDSKLMEAMSSIPDGDMVLIEDLDSCDHDIRGEVRVEGASSSVSLDVLLNLLDGPLAPEGRILFITANDKDKLPHKLLQEGRVNFEMEYGNADHDQIIRYGQELDLDAGVIEEAMKKFPEGERTMAEVAEYMNSAYFGEIMKTRSIAEAQKIAQEAQKSAQEKRDPTLPVVDYPL